ncbi:MAG: hypothetical protein FD160_3780 [Caulobacteraceae bacterium]|nr:MAG: hypothetical protein FD160_3780 [Caulobacteraceae bacterium]
MARREQGTGAMNRERMTAILEAYGAAPARWPEAERAAAQAWAAAHGAEFATMARAEAALDGLLALDGRESGDDAALAARILATLAHGDHGGDHGGKVLRPDFGRRAAAQGVWRQAAALAACAALGVAIGFTNVRPDEDVAYEMDAAFGAAFQAPGAGFVDGAGG